MTEVRRATRRLLWLGIVCAAAAARVDFLWLAREPLQGGGMGFAVRRLGLSVRLSAARYDLFAAVAAAVAVGCLAVAFVAARRAVFGGRGERRAWRTALAWAALLACVVPWHYVLGWADGGLCRLAYFGSAWHRDHLFKHLGLVSAPQLFWLGAALCLGAWLLVTPRPWPSETLSRVLAAVERAPRWVPVAVASLFVAVLGAAFSVAVLHGLPHYVDGFGYYFQAKTFAAGRLWSPLVGAREFFDPRMCPYGFELGFIFVGGRWFFAGLPAAPLVYAVGMRLGCPWLMGPLAAGGVVAAGYFLALECSGRMAALLALPLVALSGWLVFDSAEYLTHVPCMLAMLLFMGCALRAMRTGAWPWAAAAGLALGLGVNARPLTAAALGVPFAVAWVWWLVRRPRAAWVPSVAFALALAVPIAGLLAYNAATTGSPLTFGYQLCWRDTPPVPGVEAVIPGWHWRPVVGIAGLMGLLYEFSGAMYRWPLPAAGAILAAAALLGFAGPTRRAPVWVLLSAACLWLAHLRWSEPMMETLSGPRYVSEALPLLGVVAAVLLYRAHGRLVAAGLSLHRVRAVLLVVLACCFWYGAAVTVGGRLPVYGAPSGRSADERLHRVAEHRAERPALIFVPVLATARATTAFTAAIAQNDPAMSGPLLYARDLGERNRELIAKFPGRHLYRWDDAAFSLEPLGADGLPARLP